MISEPDPETLPDDEVVCRIVRLTEGLNDFWSNPFGWAPEDAANLLKKSRLDRYASLSRCLALWSSGSSWPDENGALILAWVNLGALVEGTLKLFLAVYYDEYSSDPQAYQSSKGKLIDPDALALEQLRQFLTKRDLLTLECRDFVKSMQSWRNGIHFFKDREIGSFREYQDAVRQYLCFLRTVRDHLPYPGDHLAPSEM